MTRLVLHRMWAGGRELAMKEMIPALTEEIDQAYMALGKGFCNIDFPGAYPEAETKVRLRSTDFRALDATLLAACWHLVGGRLK